MSSSATRARSPSLARASTPNPPTIRVAVLEDISISCPACITMSFVTADSLTLRSPFTDTSRSPDTSVKAPVNSACPNPPLMKAPFRPVIASRCAAEANTLPIVASNWTSCRFAVIAAPKSPVLDTYRPVIATDPAGAVTATDWAVEVRLNESVAVTSALAAELMDI